MTTKPPIPGLTVESIGQYIRAQRRAAELSLRELAARAGVSNPYLSQIERGLRKPSAEILQQIAKGLRVSAETLYARAGILDDRAGEPDVTTAIRADRGLTDRQRRVLLDIYEAFQHENAAVAQAADQATGGTAASSTPSHRGGAGDVWAEATKMPDDPAGPLG